MMEVATHQPLARTYTAPSSVHQRLPSGPPGGLMNNTSHQSVSTQYSAYSQHSSIRASDSTQGTSASTLFAQQGGYPSNGGPIEASNNVINKRADKETSLFQICINLRLRMSTVPEFGQILLNVERDADDDTDPVTLLWRTFRLGYPLMYLFNALNPQVPLKIDESIKEEKKARMATYKFLQACTSQLNYATEECFILQDLYGDDTAGFVKVTRVVNRIIDRLASEGRLIAQVDQYDGAPADLAPGARRTQRQHIIDELVKTERTYVQHLEVLQDFKKLVEEKGVITGDAVHDIFLNLNALLDFQRRFLIRVEQTNAQPESEQNWGKLFVLYKNSFRVYEPYIANQKKCEEVVMREFEKLRETGGPTEMRQMVESPTNLTSFLLKPFQRLSKYPLLLRELRDKGDLDEERRDDISTGIEAASSVLQRTNDAIDQEERKEAVEDLKARVEDWKGHRMDGFGELLLHGTFQVLKGDGGSSSKGDQEREYKIYLFEMILLCCKEMNGNKPKNRLANTRAPNGKPKLQLKGRIFMQNVTDLIQLQKPGSYTCQIFWKGDPGIENFVIRFPTEETMKKWAAQVADQRKHWAEQANTNRRTGASTSATEFNYMRDMINMENPYRQDDDEDEDDIDTVGPGGHAPQGLDMGSRNGSNSSLRSRSTTGDSGPPVEGGQRQPPPRFPMAITPQPLTLQTRGIPPAVTTPNGGPAESYFSPSVESPVSSRTSSSSTSMFPFPRQQTPNQYYDEHSGRYTAPAVSRNYPPGQPGGPNGYQVSSRNAVQRPSLPPSAATAPNIATQSRLRSASSPDIHNPQVPVRRPGQPGVPDVPPFPTHYAYAPGIVNRSQSNSPNGPPLTRAATQSPALQRERLEQARAATADQFYGHHGGPARRDPSYAPMVRNMTPGSIDYSRNGTPASIDSRTMSPPLPMSTPRPEENIQFPSQLKVKVHCPSAGTTMTLVVSTNISYQSLKDRIDAKLQRATDVSLAGGTVRLKYMDEDDYITIQSDEDVQTAFETWREQQRDQFVAGQLGEIELYCQR